MSQKKKVNAEVDTRIAEAIESSIEAGTYASKREAIEQALASYFYPSLCKNSTDANTDFDKDEVSVIERIRNWFA